MGSRARALSPVCHHRGGYHERRAAGAAAAGAAAASRVGGVPDDVVFTGMLAPPALAAMLRACAVFAGGSEDLSPAESLVRDRLVPTILGSLLTVMSQLSVDS